MSAMLARPFIAGIDEVGRGAVAGPVVAGACVLMTPLFRRRRAFPCWSPFERKKKEEIPIADSKALTSEERECAFAWIAEHCRYGFGIVSHEIVEERGILAATNEAMLLALAHLRSHTPVDELIVDGRDHFQFPLPHRTLIRGDSIEPSIAAASIVAKVTRDRFMQEISLSFPLYGFHRHKGYGTPEHLAVIEEYGPCEIHRKTFLRALLEHQELPLEMLEEVVSIG